MKKNFIVSGIMRKALLMVFILCFCVFSTFASKSWFGIEGFTTRSEETRIYNLLGIDFSEDSTATVMGIAVSGTLFPNQESPLGIGYQIGAGKIIEATQGSSQEDVSDYPLTWRGSLSIQYGATFTEQLSMELGVGGLYESMTRGADSNNPEVIVEYNMLSFIANTKLLLKMSDSLAILGGLSVSTPLSSETTVTSGSISYGSYINVIGYTILGQLGLALSL